MFIGSILGAVGTKRRGGNVAAEPAYKRRKEDTDLYPCITKNQLFAVTELFVRMEREDSKTYDFLSKEERVTIIEWLLDLVIDTQGFRDKVRAVMDDLDSFNNNYGIILDAALEKKAKYLEERRTERMLGTKADLDEKRSLAKRAESAFRKGE